jgi:hypothetical protein
MGWVGAVVVAAAWICGVWIWSRGSPVLARFDEHGVRIGDAKVLGVIPWRDVLEVRTWRATLSWTYYVRLMLRPIPPYLSLPQHDYNKATGQSGPVIGVPIAFTGWKRDKLRQAIEAMRARYAA